MTPEERKSRLYRAMGEQEQSRRRRSSRVQTAENSSRTDRKEYVPGQQMHRYASSRRIRRRGPDWGKVIAAFPTCAVLVAGAVWVIRHSAGSRILTVQAASESLLQPESVPETETVTETTVPETESVQKKVDELLEAASLKAAQYDYDGAAELVNASPELSENDRIRSFLEELETVKAGLVEQDVTKITHVFFHILTVDSANAFSEKRWGQKQARGYNSLMTTIPEFRRILEEMYKKGYVLVSLHDMGYMEKQEDGTEKMVRGKIMLPEGKKAFVMSEDDVCYYEYMKGAGFADRMVIDENGKPVLHYTDKDGNEFTGDYDIVPILDKFIEEHPDFSYHGHKACLVFTGYNGVLGYRTDETYLPENYEAHKVEGGHDVEAERKEAVEVLKVLAADGYDLGCHSWGHRDMGAMSLEAMKTDMEKWDRNVNSLIREATGSDADILIYPKGADIGDWRGYTSKDQKKEGCLQKFNWLYEKGFRYFCNVDSSQYWIQFGDSYLRTGRRALDGYNLYIDIEENLGRFADLWDDTSYIFDSDRPTPVYPY